MVSLSRRKHELTTSRILNAGRGGHLDGVKASQLVLIFELRKSAHGALDVKLVSLAKTHSMFELSLPSLGEVYLDAIAPAKIPWALPLSLWICLRGHATKRPSHPCSRSDSTRYIDNIVHFYVESARGP